MSAFSIGSQSSDKPLDKPVDKTPADQTPAQAFVKWIPGDAIVLYTGIIAAGAQQGPLPDNPTPDQVLEHVNSGSAAWFLFALMAAGILVVSGAISGKSAGAKLSPLSISTRIVLCLIAFTIWTTLLPGAWPYTWNFVRDMGPLYGVVVAFVAVVFTGIAELVTGKNKTL